MRLDLFLKSSRLVPRRSLAQQLCEAGRVSVNSLKAKPAREVKIGDVLELRRRDKITSIKVLSIPARKQVSVADAAALYEVMSETAEGDEFSSGLAFTLENKNNPAT